MNRNLSLTVLGMVSILLMSVAVASAQAPQPADVTTPTGIGSEPYPPPADADVAAADANANLKLPFDDKADVAAPRGVFVIRNTGTGVGIGGITKGSAGIYGEGAQRGVHGYGRDTGVGVFGESEREDGIVGQSNGSNRSGVFGATFNPDGFGGAFHNLSGGVALTVEGNGSERDKAALRVNNGQTERGMAAYLTNNSNYATAHFANGGDGQVLFLQGNGGTFIQAVTADGRETRFSVDKDGKTTTRALIITGGADLSEQFDINTAQTEFIPSAGQTVCIDPAQPGALVICRQAYDRTVAGIISGAGGVNPGMVMEQAGSEVDGNYPVALTGRVYVWADAGSGAIQPGDLLTTAVRPGHAMKVNDYEHAQGAILGKAMTRLEQGTGLVLVLVSLQ